MKIISNENGETIEKADEMVCHIAQHHLQDR